MLILTPILVPRVPAVPNIMLCFGRTVEHGADSQHNSQAHFNDAVAFSTATDSVVLHEWLKKEPGQAKSRKTNILLIFSEYFFPFYRMPFCNLLFYTQCCDVNQPLHPRVCAIPTLGEASGSSPGHRFLLQSFPRRRLGQRSSWTQHVAAPCLASIPQVTPLPLSAPWPVLFLRLHAQALLVQRSERLEDTHQCHQTLTCPKHLCLCHSWKDNYKGYISFTLVWGFYIP